MASSAPPFFDRDRNAWVLARYRDVAAALREPRLVPASARSATPAIPLDAAAHARFRAEAMRILPPQRLRQWESEFTARARQFAGRLPVGCPVDLLARFAKPWSLDVALLAAEVPADRSEPMCAFAQTLFDAACEPYDAALDEPARHATQALARGFRDAPALRTQMFPALACSLPAFLGNAWLELIERPAHWERLGREPDLLPKGLEELLRLSGPARAQFRQAIAPVSIHDCHIQPQQKVILRLDLANRDPEHFPSPDEISLERPTTDHLAFGAGLHACVGATLIRSAAAAATQALLECFGPPMLVSADPGKGFAVRHLQSLAVVLAPK